jgi:hypothetical protein
MAVWISTQEFMNKTGLSHSGARKAISQKRYKKQPLAIDVDKNRPGKPAYLVAWNDQTNLPATATDLQASTSIEQPLAVKDDGIFLGAKANVVPINKPDIHAIANSISAESKSMASEIRIDDVDTGVVVETQAAAVLQDENLDVVDEQEPNFENLLEHFLAEKKRKAVVTNQLKLCVTAIKSIMKKRAKFTMQF